MNWKSYLKGMFDIREDMADEQTIRERISDGGKIKGTNMFIIICAIMIASIGLNMNSTAIIIGAMLISPLMGTILAVAYGLYTGDNKMLARSAIGFVFQIVISVTVSTIYFLISPISSETSELLARTSPTVWDIFVAFFGGFAGMVGTTRKDKASNILPGVAIATAIMPPLCTCGYSIATRNMHYLAGAFYLFMINAYFIFFSSIIVLAIEGIKSGFVRGTKKARIAFSRLIIFAIVMTVPAIGIAGNMIADQRQDSNSVTGFETSDVNEVTLAKQASILFPDIKSISVSNTDNYDENGEKTTTDTTVTVYVDRYIQGDELKRLDLWLDSVYNKDVDIIQHLTLLNTEDETETETETETDEETKSDTGEENAVEIISKIK